MKSHRAFRRAARECALPPTCEFESESMAFSGVREYGFLAYPILIRVNIEKTAKDLISSIHLYMFKSIYSLLFTHKQKKGI